ncbi:MAG TPA: diadenylate cyclase CdaA [Anaerolineales bacterium]|nr:diadenylate cyclase CdaA [Anaerolineales bacterium]
MLNTLLGDFSSYIQRLNWLSVLDLLLVTAVLYVLLRLVRGTRAVVLLRGMVVLVVGLAVLTSLVPLPGFTWLLRTMLPALLIAIPVIFAPEIRRALERLGRAGPLFNMGVGPSDLELTIASLTTGAQRLSDRGLGGLIVIEREVRLGEYLETGVALDAILSPELMLQIFHVNTPLHDGAVILRGDRIAAAACVLPLSSSGTLSPSRDRQMGLRHRAALGISEVSDAVAVVISEENGAISVAHNGRMIRRLDPARLRNILFAFYRPRPAGTLPAWLTRLTRTDRRGSKEPVETAEAAK